MNHAPTKPLQPLKDLFSERPPRDEPHAPPDVRTPTEQVQAAHRRRLVFYMMVEALFLTPFLFQTFAGGLGQQRGWGWTGMIVSEFSRTLGLWARRRMGLWEGLSGLFVAVVGVGIPSGGWDWLAIALVYLAKALTMTSRYACTFGSVDGPLAMALVACHGLAGVLVGGAFLSRAGGLGGDGFFNACELRHHCSAVLLGGLLSAVADAAFLFYRRGNLSARGLGPFRKPPANGRQAHSVLARGYDQSLFDLQHFVTPDPVPRKGGPHWFYNPPPISRHGRMLLPALPPAPHDLPFFIGPEVPEWVKTLARFFCTRGLLLAQELELVESAVRGLLTCVAVAVLVLPCEGVLRMGAAVFYGEDGGPAWLSAPMGSLWQALPTVSKTTLMVTLYVYISLSASTLLLYHLLRQPVDFSVFTTYKGSVLQSWLEKGWTVILQDPRPLTGEKGGSLLGTVNLASAQQEEMWRAELEDSEKVLYRTAVLANRAVFPPRLEAHNNVHQISVTDKLYRAQAYLDLAILAHTDATRRQWVYHDMPLWRGHCRPLLTVINALTFQLELQMEASGRVEGGVKSPLSTLHTRLGLAEPRDAQCIATLVIETEVRRRMEDLLQQRRKNGEPISAEQINQPESFLLPAQAPGVLGARTLTPLSLPTLDLQVVELAALALGALYENAVGFDESTKLFEDSRGCSRHSIPAALSALLSCQLAVHLYSTMVQSGGLDGEEYPAMAAAVGGAAARGRRGGGMDGGGGGGPGFPRFNLTRDRPSVVIPKFVGVSLALDQAIEQIVVQFYASDFQAFSFAPLYARCLKMYVECLAEREVGGGGLGSPMSSASPGRRSFGGSPSPVRHRRRS